jgi:hypothetical protein
MWLRPGVRRSREALCRFTNRPGSAFVSTGRILTEINFDGLSWHDCHVYAIGFDVGSPDENDWTSDLILELDFIVEWLGPSAGTFAFRVAPATLVFHGVTDPRIDITWEKTGFQGAIHEISIDAITRERIKDQKVFLNRPYYSWRIALNWPAGEITFGAVGFTQTLLADPVRQDGQHLSRSIRRRLTTKGT